MSEIARAPEAGDLESGSGSSDHDEEDEDCEWCAESEPASVKAAIEYKARGWDPERKDCSVAPEGYGFVFGSCEWCGRWRGFEEADAAYAEAPVLEDYDGPASPADELRGLVVGLGLDPEDFNALAEHWAGRPMA